jgi:hypothetical protein
MPQHSKGPRLYLHPRNRDWVIRDGTVFIRTGCSEKDKATAEKRLGQYLASKYETKPSAAPLILDMLALFGKEAAPHKDRAHCRIQHHQSNEVVERQARIRHFGQDMPRLCSDQDGIRRGL